MSQSRTPADSSNTSSSSAPSSNSSWSWYHYPLAPVYGVGYGVSYVASSVGSLFSSASPAQSSALSAATPHKTGGILPGKTSQDEKPAEQAAEEQQLASESVFKGANAEATGVSVDPIERIKKELEQHASHASEMRIEFENFKKQLFQIQLENKLQQDEKIIETKEVKFVSSGDIAKRLDDMVKQGQKDLAEDRKKLESCDPQSIDDCIDVCNHAIKVADYFCQLSSHIQLAILEKQEKQKAQVHGTHEILPNILLEAAKFLIKYQWPMTSFFLSYFRTSTMSDALATKLADLQLDQQVGPEMNVERDLDERIEALLSNVKDKVSKYIEEKSWKIVVTPSSLEAVSSEEKQAVAPPPSPSSQLRQPARKQIKFFGLEFNEQQLQIARRKEAGFLTPPPLASISEGDEKDFEHIARRNSV